MSSFLPVFRLGLANPERYIAFPLFPHLSDLPLNLNPMALYSEVDPIIATEIG